MTRVFTKGKPTSGYIYYVLWSQTFILKINCSVLTNHFPIKVNISLFLIWEHKTDLAEYIVLEKPLMFYLLLWSFELPLCYFCHYHLWQVAIIFPHPRVVPGFRIAQLQSLPVVSALARKCQERHPHVKKRGWGLLKGVSRSYSSIHHQFNVCYNSYCSYSSHFQIYFRAI